MNVLGADFVKRLSLTWIDPPRIRESVRPAGPERSVEVWREDIARTRQSIVGQAGIFLDRSPPGAGKSTADIKAAANVSRMLVVSPTHENCKEVEEGMRNAGIDAAAYPGRLTVGDEPNCWNPQADAAEKLGLSAVAAVCSTCTSRKSCLSSGYLAQVSVADFAKVAIATHARATYNGLLKLGEGRSDLISVHEDAANLVRPTAVAAEEDLQEAGRILNHVLNAPDWLNWLGQAASRDESGMLVPNEKLAERRGRLDQFVRLLADLIDELTDRIRGTVRTISVELPPPTKKAVGIENLLLIASQETKASFKNSPWRLLLSVLIGEVSSLGVVCDRDFRKHETGDASNPIQKQLMAVWTNLPSSEATVLFSDATMSHENLESLTGQKITDITPEGHIRSAKRIIQYPVDLTGKSARERFLSILRGLLLQFRNSQQIGVITHQRLRSFIRDLHPRFLRRVEKTAYFWSGEDRASNDWCDSCDLIIVAGTPRVPTAAVQMRLLQLGDFTAAGEDGRWGACHWRGQTESGREETICGWGYGEPGWDRAHRSLVRAAIIQAAGRSRSLLVSGLDVVIVSNEECGSELLDDLDIEFTESDGQITEAICELSAEFPYRDIQGISADARGITTTHIAQAAGLSERQSRDILARLETRGYIQRIGERGGWRAGPKLPDWFQPD